MAEEELTSEQRRALAALAATRGECPPADALVEYEALGEDERSAHAIHAHVQACSRCQLVLLHLDEPREVSTRTSVRWAFPLAAALTLAAAGALIYRTLPGQPAIETVRGSELQPISPAGDVGRLTLFRWQSPIDAAKYRVTVFRGQDTVWTGESVETEISAQNAALAPGTYEWQVDAVDAEGSVRMSSPRTRFTLAP